MTSGRRSVLWIATASLLAIPGLPRAATALDFQVTLSPGGTLQDTSPVYLSNDTGRIKAEGSAGARLSANTRTFAAAPFSLNIVIVETAASVSATYDDIVITGPTPTVMTTLHVPFYARIYSERDVWAGLQFGFHSATTNDGMFRAQFGSVSTQVVFRIIPYDATADVTVQSSGAGANATPVVHQIGFFSEFAQQLVGSNGSDAFAGLRGKETFGVSGEMTLSAEVPTNTMLTLGLSLNIAGQARADFLASATSDIEAPSSFGIPQGEPVFDLPEGYTANSPSLLLVDNFVPEPSSGVTSLAAVVGLIGLGHQRRCGRGAK